MRPAWRRGSVGVAVVSTVAAASIASTSDITGFADAYLVCGIVAAVAALVAVALVPGGRPQAVTGHGH
jgi:hypothetical protein